MNSIWLVVVDLRITIIYDIHTVGAAIEFLLIEISSCIVNINLLLHTHNQRAFVILLRLFQLIQRLGRQCHAIPDSVLKTSVPAGEINSTQLTPQRIYIHLMLVFDLY